MGMINMNNCVFNYGTESANVETTQAESGWTVQQLRMNMFPQAAWQPHWLDLAAMS